MATIEILQGNWYLVRIKAGEHISGRALHVGIKAGQVRKATAKVVSGDLDFWIDDAHCTFITEVEVLRELK